MLFARHQSHRAAPAEVSACLRSGCSPVQLCCGRRPWIRRCRCRGSRCCRRLGAVICRDFAQPAAWRSSDDNVGPGRRPVSSSLGGRACRIRAALSAGFRVFGLSSMGAIRAREMAALGMEGFGEVYQDVLPARGRFSRRRSDPATIPSRRIASCPSPWFTCGRRSMISCSGGYCPPRWPRGSSTSCRAPGLAIAHCPRCALLASHGLVGSQLAAVDEQLADFDRYRVKALDLIAFLQTRPDRLPGAKHQRFSVARRPTASRTCRWARAGPAPGRCSAADEAAGPRRLFAQQIVQAGEEDILVENGHAAHRVEVWVLVQHRLQQARQAERPGPEGDTASRCARRRSARLQTWVARARGLGCRSAPAPAPPAPTSPSLLRC